MTLVQDCLTTFDQFINYGRQGAELVLPFYRENINNTSRQKLLGKCVNLVRIVGLIRLVNFRAPHYMNTELRLLA